MLYWAIIAVVHWAVTFYTDHFIFREAALDHLAAYLFLKGVLLLVLLAAWRGISLAVKKNDFWRNVFLYAFIYASILVAYILLGHPIELAGDEISIFNAVTGYDIYPGHFTYITGLVYGVALMIFPFTKGVFVMKILLQAMACGYCIEKSNKILDSKKGIIIYLVFLLPGVLQNTLRIHRMQFYGILYLVLVVKLLSDYYGKKKQTLIQLIPVMVIFDILAIWRKEGIYLFVLAPILICLAYFYNEKKAIMHVIVLFAVVSFTVYVPQLMAKEAFATESSHTYNQWFVNMCRNGLDQSKYERQLEDIDKVLSIDAVNKINAELGDQNYMEEYIAWYGDYVGVRSEFDFTLEEYDAYAKAIQHIIIHEPIVFIRTCVGMWNYSANAYDILSLRGIARFILKGLYLPLFILISTVVVGMKKKNWLLMWIALGILAHCGVTVLFAPAAYFKYYYQLYMVGNYFAVMLILEKINKKGSMK